MKRKGLIILAILCLFLLLTNVASAEEKSWEYGLNGADFGDMVQNSPNVIFAQITGVSANSVQAAVSVAIKGKAHGNLTITNLKKHKTLNISDARKVFKPGDDYFFFLNAALVGSLPFEVTKNAIAVQVKRNKVEVSIISPIYKEYKHELSYEMFSNYLTALVAADKGEAINPDFLLKIETELKEASADPNNKELATLLKMVIQIDPLYKDQQVLMSMLDSTDVNNKLMAIQTLVNIYPRLDKSPAKKDKSKKSKKSKKYGKRKGKKGKVSGFKQEIFEQFVSIMKTEKNPVVQSAIAMAISKIHNDSALRDMADMIKPYGIESGAYCEVIPKAGLEVPKKALLRAIIDFEGDLTLDILERELRRDDVSTFRMILEIFRDYLDMNLNLLLLDLLQDRNFLPRQVAILEYFHLIKDNETIKGLKDLYISPEVGSEYIRKSIIEVFEDYNEPHKTTDFLIKYGLHDPSPVVRQATAKALGKLGDIKAVKAFKEIYFKESNRLAREFYVEALSKIKSPLAYDCLVWLEQKETDKHMLKQIRFAVKKSKHLSR